MISITPQPDPPQGAIFPPPPPPPPQYSPQQYTAPPVNRAATRYSDAYHVARVQTTIGNVVKVISIVIGGIIVAPSLLSGLASLNASQSPFGPAAGLLGLGTAFMGTIIGGVIGGIGFMIGVMISAQGQLMKAALDSAVNTSPFMNEDDKARVMSL